MSAPVFTGVGVALITVFEDGGALNAPATAGVAAKLVERGVRAVVVAGTTGEAWTLSVDERTRLLKEVRVAVAGAAPVIAGTGAPAVETAVDLTRDAVANGADAVLVLSPRDVADPREYYAAVVVAAGELPVLAYHFPTVSPPGIPIEVLSELPVNGLKDSSGDPDRLLAELTTWDGHLYTGSSALLALAGPLGCAGAILSLANLAPEGCAKAFAGDAAAQRALAPVHLESHRDFPRGLKRMVAAEFGVSAVTRA